MTVTQTGSLYCQEEIRLPAKRRGFHLISQEIDNIFNQMPPVKVGLLHVFMCHTSASLTINENADPTVRKDFESHFNQMFPEDAPYLEHVFEGSDDMPAHLKASTLGSELVIPVKNSQLLMGTWQGIYLCEHRNNASGRKVVLTLQGSSS